jgi:hypothetical protein
VDAVRQWNLESNRFEVWKDLDRVRFLLWQWLRDADSMGRDYAKVFGLVIEEHEAPPTVYRTENGPAVEIHSARPALRHTQSGSTRTDLVIEITQRRRGYFDEDVQKKMDAPSDGVRKFPEPDFEFRAGCTVLVDPVTAEVRRVIRTAGTIADTEELDRVRRYLTGQTGAIGNAFDAGLATSLRQDRGERNEPFALLHSLED